MWFVIAILVNLSVPQIPEFELQSHLLVRFREICSLAQLSVNGVIGPRFGPLPKNAHLGSMWHNAVKPSDKVT